MTILNAELRHEIEKAGDESVRIEDPETHTIYVLVKAEHYDRITSSRDNQNSVSYPVPEGIQRSKQAFLRDLPELLTRKRLRGRWVLYHGDKQIGIWRNPRRMLRESEKLGLSDEESYFGMIAPHPEEDEVIETSLFEFEDLESNS